MNIIEAKEVSAAYDAGEPIFSGVSLAVKSGENIAILGPSGCGKSTFLKLLAGVKQPSSGEITRANVNGHPLRAGLMFQQPLLLPWCDVLENVALGGKYFRSDEAREARLDPQDLLAKVGLCSLGKRRPHELSGGQRQRVALARTLAHLPDVLLLDEPFSALDIELRSSLRYLVLSIANEMGITIVLVTHQQDEAASFGGRIVNMEELAVKGHALHSVSNAVAQQPVLR